MTQTEQQRGRGRPKAFDEFALVERIRDVTELWRIRDALVDNGEPAGQARGLIFWLDTIRAGDPTGGYGREMRTRYRSMLARLPETAFPPTSRRRRKAAQAGFARVSLLAGTGAGAVVVALALRNPSEALRAISVLAADNARYVNLPGWARGDQPPHMTPADLVEIELIKRLKYRYARCLDQKRWDEIVECFTPDAIAAYSGGGYTFEGRDAIVDFLRRSMGAETFHSSHKMHHPEIDLVGPDSARGVWALDDVVVMTDFALTIRGCSFYDDEYVKRAGVWRIQRTGYKRVFEEIQPRGNVEGLRLTASWWATGGRSELPAG